VVKVDLQPEPSCFDSKVRQKGLNYIKQKGIDINKPLPNGVTLKSYWRDCYTELYERYNGVCAYLAIYFEKVTGAGSVEHYLPKKLRPDLAYEWENYRLATGIVNSRKRDYIDVIDPAYIHNEWFYLELTTGHIYPNPSLAEYQKDAAQKSIDRLRLDDGEMRRIRTKTWNNYCEGKISKEYLKEIAPHIYAEAVRQNLL